MGKLVTIVLGDTDENADWILTEKQRQEEIAIHDKLDEEREQQEPQEA